MEVTTRLQVDFRIAVGSTRREILEGQAELLGGYEVSEEWVDVGRRSDAKTCAS